MKILQDDFKTLHVLEPRGRIVLRHSAGKMVNMSDAETMMLFYRALPQGIPDYLHDRWFFAFCIDCLWEPDQPNKKPLENIFSELLNGSESTASLQKRIMSLMDSKWDDDGYFAVKMLRIIKFVKQKGYAIDAASLLQNFLHWNDDSHWIQKKWASAISHTENINIERKGE